MTDTTEETSERKKRRRRRLENQEKIRRLKESLFEQGGVPEGNIICMRGMYSHIQ